MVRTALGLSGISVQRRAVLLAGAGLGDGAMSAKLADVVELFPDGPCSDIPAMLRKSAASIETEAEEGFSPTRCIIAVQVAANGAINVYGWGKTDSMHAIAVLHRGIANLTSNFEDGE